MNAYELADAIEDWETGANFTLSIKAGQMLRQQADRIADLEKQLNTPKTYVLDGKQVFDTTPQIKELSDEEIKKCVIAWVKQIYGNEYVTPSDSHIINGTKLIRLAEKRIFKNDSL